MQHHNTIIESMPITWYANCLAYNVMNYTNQGGNMNQVPQASKHDREWRKKHIGFMPIRELSLDNIFEFLLNGCFDDSEVFTALAQEIKRREERT